MKSSATLPGGRQCLGNIRDDGQPSRHIAINGAVAHRQLGFVSCGEKDGAILVGEGHEQVASDAGLDVLFRHVLWSAAEWPGQLCVIGLHDICDADCHRLQAQIMRQKHCVFDARLAGVGRRHEHA